MTSDDHVHDDTDRLTTAERLDRLFPAPSVMNEHCVCRAGYRCPWCRPGPVVSGLAPCGTPAAYRRHLRRGEKTCAACRRAQAVSIAVRRTGPVAPPRELRPCGTEAAYQRHIRRREVTCRTCCTAHAAYVAQLRRGQAA